MQLHIYLTVLSLVFQASSKTWVTDYNSLCGTAPPEPSHVCRLVLYVFHRVVLKYCPSSCLTEVICIKQCWFFDLLRHSGVFSSSSVLLDEGMVDAILQLCGQKAATLLVQTDYVSKSAT